MLFLILSENFYDICISNGYSRPRCCRNSSAVEHFTRNEGVPGSNPGFGSKEPGRQTVILVLFYPAQKLPNKVFSALYSPSKYSFTTSKLRFFRLRKP